MFGFCSFPVLMNWTASEMIMPPFLERNFGEQTPIYTVQSINLFGCLIMYDKCSWVLLRKEIPRC